MQTPNLTSLLDVVTKERLVALGRRFDVAVRAQDTKAQQIEALVGSGALSFTEVLRHLGRDELRLACRRLGLPAGDRSRAVLASRLQDAHGDEAAEPISPSFTTAADRPFTPRPGDVAVVRQRQYLVEEVVSPADPRDATLVQLVCLDDDAAGRRLEVLWELELGARVRQPEHDGLGEIDALDPPEHFGAYLQTLRWHGVTATDARLFQAPFRAGIQLLNHQLTPLEKALRLPRANLFIADDVGLGKTIEAGLVLQELRLRQRVDFVLIVCPAAICLQWRDEMAKRFGLQFEIYNRTFMANRRRERGFAVNPWTTHSRFVISHTLIRRPEYRDPLLQVLGERAKKSLLILDEAHVAAPASANKYAIDSRVTRTVRDIAPRFENRLFLSATPHNGHSNSFSSLLELLDPQRFTRGVPIADPAELEPVLVRRLKPDLRALGVESFPERRVIAIDLRHDGTTWTERPIEQPLEHGASDTASDCEAGPVPLAGGQQEPVELLLAERFAAYREALMPRLRKRDRIALAGLQKQLLSSIEAFYRTLQVHRRTFDRRLAQRPEQQETFQQQRALQTDPEEDERGLSDDELDAADAAAIASATARLPDPDERLRAQLDELIDLAARSRGLADAKALALLAWIRRHQCPAVGPHGNSHTDSPTESSASTRDQAPDTSWTGRRVIVFTESGDTKRYLHQILTKALADTDRAQERILHFHGGMSDEQREEVQAAFNSDPDEHPCRILLATDAAREGVNLQGHCADLFHYDLPWNPARLEQRNGRIDRTLQPAPEVRCHYFRYPQRREDAVLRKLVEKVETIRRELGSLGTVVLDNIEKALEQGIDDEASARLDRADRVDDLGERNATAARELEATRQLDALRRQIDEAGEILDASRTRCGFDPTALRHVVDVGLRFAGYGTLEPGPEADPEADDGPRRYRLPEMGDSWQPTLDTLRPARGRDEPFWEWRRRPPLPVVFEPLGRLDASCAQLHLEHPFVRRLLQRFLAQGYAAHDLARVTVLRDPSSSLARVVALGRLVLFGAGAARLHDELVAIAAPWYESGGERHLQPFAEAAERRALDTLWARLAEPDGQPVGAAVRERLRATAAGDFATLWPAVRDEADTLAHEAERRLAERGAKEAADLRAIIGRQRRAIERAVETSQQAELLFEPSERAQREQFEQDLRHMQRRLTAIDRELDAEPRQIEQSYEVALQRLEPVGLVYLWPETRG